MAAPIQIQHGRYIKATELEEIRACGRAQTWFSEKFGKCARISDVLLAAVRAGSPDWIGFYFYHSNNFTEKHVKAALTRSLRGALTVARSTYERELVQRALDGKEIDPNYTAHIKDASRNPNHSRRAAVCHAISGYLEFKQNVKGRALYHAFHSCTYVALASKRPYPRAASAYRAVEYGSATSFVRSVFTPTARTSARKQAA